MKIFGIGLSRTGTTSLSNALTILGYKSIHFWIDEESRNDIFCGRFKNKTTEETDAILDTPMCNYFKEYDKIYPDSKFIFTDRSLTTWLASCKIFFRENRKFQENIHKEWTIYANIATYGINFYNEDRFINVYENHKKNVIDYFKDKNNLLVMNICEGDGWEKICKFLNKPIPNALFPHENKIKKYKPITLC